MIVEYKDHVEYLVVLSQGSNFVSFGKWLSKGKTIGCTDWKRSICGCTGSWLPQSKHRLWSGSGLRLVLGIEKFSGSRRTKGKLLVVGAFLIIGCDGSWPWSRTLSGCTCSWQTLMRDRVV